MDLRLIADQALGESRTRQSDGLGFEVYARVLSQAALDTPGPFTIGVFGEWGTGKTSLMRLIQASLANQPNVVTVWFNAWKYEKEEHPIVPLVGTIIQELERKESSKFEQSGKSLVRALRAIAYGFSAKSTVKVPGFAEIEASFVAKDIIDRKEQLTSDPLLARSLYYGAFASLDAVDLKNDIRIVILIDDLDRCFPDQAIRLLESIKLVLAQPGFIFVLGVAREVIEGYLQHRYASDYGIKDFRGNLYLDKIVQLPFHIPPASGRMDEFSRRILEGQPHQVIAELSETLSTIADSLGGNPRAVIRFTNNLLIDLAINSELATAGLMERIPINYFAISRCLEQRWPEVFSPLVGSSELAEEVSKWDISAAATYAQDSGPRARIAASLVSDQRLADLLLGSEGKSWLNNSQLRNASIGFLRTQRRTSELDTAEAPVQYDTYISYHRDDSGYVVKIAQMLSEHGLRVFFDVDDLKAGDTWSSTISSAFEKSRTICFCIGRKSFESQWQVEELDSAIANSQIIIPVVLPNAQPDPNAIPDAIKERNWLIFKTDIDTVNIEQLVDAIESSPRLKVEEEPRRGRFAWRGSRT